MINLTVSILKEEDFRESSPISGTCGANMDTPSSNLQMYFSNTFDVDSYIFIFPAAVRVRLLLLEPRRQSDERPERAQRRQTNG